MPVIAFPAKASPHLPMPGGWTAELPTPCQPVQPKAKSVNVTPSPRPPILCLNHSLGTLELRCKFGNNRSNRSRVVLGQTDEHTHIALYNSGS